MGFSAESTPRARSTLRVHSSEMIFVGTPASTKTAPKPEKPEGPKDASVKMCSGLAWQPGSPLADLSPHGPLCTPARS